MTSMTDKKLLKLAAKAAGIDIQEWRESYEAFKLKEPMMYWNPLTDDGDALRLSVNLASTRKGTLFQIVISCMHDGRGFVSAEFFSKDGQSNTEIDSDINAATRRAIVRAAAEIGKTL